MAAAAPPRRICPTAGCCTSASTTTAESSGLEPRRERPDWFPIPRSSGRRSISLIPACTRCGRSRREPGSAPRAARCSCRAPSGVLSAPVTADKPRVAIFGATSAIAAEMARVYADRGARLFLAGRDPRKLRALVDARAGAVAGYVEVDLTVPGAAGAAVAAAIEALGGLDVAVIAHGWLGDQIASERDAAEAERIIDTNFISVVALLVPLANHFEAAGAGNIAVMSSVAGDRGRDRKSVV